MATMIGCPSCAKSIPVGSAFCPHCGAAAAPSATAPTPARRGRGVAALLAVGLIGGLLLALAAMTGSGPAPYGATPEQIAGSRERIQKAVDGGLIRRYDCAARRAYVPGPTWRALDADQKRNMTMMLANVCQGETQARMITVVDDSTGKTVATFSGGTYSVE